MSPTSSVPAREPAAADPRGLPGWVVPAVGIFAAALAAAAYVHGVVRPRTAAGLTFLGRPVGDVPFSELEARTRAAAEAWLDEELRFVAGGETARATRRQAGLSVDVAAAVVEARRIGKRWDPLADLAARIAARRGRLAVPARVALDRKKAVALLADLKEELDGAPVDARLDLERHAINPGKPGRLVKVYASLPALEAAAHAGLAEVKLAVAETPPTVTAASLAALDISTVLGRWETRYSASLVDNDRTYNLKVGASKLEGHVIQPGEVFSFNQVMGDRTEKEGYRVAPVISGGELVDGLAGGMCQIASTIHAAAFFAGMEIVSSTPHSRPSVYIPMGLDSTVVYPTVDLKLKNPFPFPVVLHLSVNQGAVKAEILGRERPWQVIFEREIKSETGFPTETRSDPEAPAGQRLTLQEGYPGYTLVRRRYLFAPGTVPRWSGPQPLDELLRKQKLKADKREQWAVRYPPTTQIVAVGTGPAGLKPKPAPPSHRIPPVAAQDKPFFKLLR